MREKLDLSCRICGDEFPCERSLHAHIKKHKMLLPEYYETFFPRSNLLTGKRIKFKSTEEYFAKDFERLSEMEEWLSLQPRKLACDYLQDILAERVAKKGYEFAPCHLDLLTSKLPTIGWYIKYCGSYRNACDAIGVKQRFANRLPDDFWEKEPGDLTILCDSREQKPILFNTLKSRGQKLDFGDYTLAGPHYNGIFIDRKSETDFKGTFSAGAERFARELERAREFNSYVFVLCEIPLAQLVDNNYGGPSFQRIKLDRMFFNIRSIMNDYGDVCQILFASGRRAMEDMIPKLLYRGPKLKSVDVQYFLDREMSK